MNVLIMPSSLKQANLKCDGVVIGIKGLSVNCPCYFEIDDLDKINNNKYVIINKNIHNKDLDYLKDVLFRLNKYNIKGLIFYDLSILNLKGELDYELIWNQEHMVNNYLSVNTMYDLGVTTSYLSNDIKFDDMLLIKEKTKSKLMVTCFGYLPMFASYRHLVDNYCHEFNLKKENDLFIEKEGNSYPIIDNEEGTFVYTNFILNGIKESLSFDYVVLNSFKIDEFEKVVDIFNNVDKNNVLKKEQELLKMFNNLSSGFFYESTVYKVK